jgi:hypothetical protein
MEGFEPPYSGSEVPAPYQLGHMTRKTALSVKIHIYDLASVRPE